jgi:hypothetical protein
MSTQGFTPAPPDLGPAIDQTRRLAETAAIRILRSVRTSSVSFAFTVVGIAAYCALDLTHGRKGW